MSAINMLYSASIISCSTPIPYVAITLKNIYLGGAILDEFTSEYYNDKNATSGLLFQQYTYIAVDKIYNPSIVNVWKANIDKAAYAEKQDLGVYIPSERR